MAEVTLMWDQRVLGRYPGDEETVELTPFIQAILDQGRAHQIDALTAPVLDAPEHEDDPAPVIDFAVPVPDPDPAPELEEVDSDQ